MTAGGGGASAADEPFSRQFRELLSAYALDTTMVILDFGLLCLFVWLNFEAAGWIEGHPTDGVALVATRSLEFLGALSTCGIFLLRMLIHLGRLARRLVVGT